MNNNASRLMDDYSGLDEKEQKEFDRRYRELMRFRKQLDQLADAVIKTKGNKRARAEAIQRVVMGKPR